MCNKVTAHDQKNLFFEQKVFYSEKGAKKFEENCRKMRLFSIYLLILRIFFRRFCFHKQVIPKPGIKNHKKDKV
jgi:hypothetical protein